MDIKAEMEGIQPYPDTKFIKFFGRLYAAVFALFAITALSVFVLPENILDASAACADFVKFMKRFFPNIAAIGKISPHTQLAEFYVAVLWVPILTAFAVSCVYCPIATFLYKKRASRRQDAAICDIARYTFCLLGIKQLFLRRFCHKRHPTQSR